MDSDNNKFKINGKVVEDINGNILHKKLKKEDASRNPSWPKLDYKKIYDAFGYLTTYEFIMCENQCKTTDLAIKAVSNYRKSKEDTYLQELLADNAREKARMRYIRSHYNDLEDDNYERQEVRKLNG